MDFMQIVKDNLKDYNINKKIKNIDNYNVKIEDVGSFSFSCVVDRVDEAIVGILVDGIVGACLISVNSYFASNKTDHIFSDKEEHFRPVLYSALIKKGMRASKAERSTKQKEGRNKSTDIWLFDMFNMLVEYKHVFRIPFRGDSIPDEVYVSINEDIVKLRKVYNHHKNFWNIPGTIGFTKIALEGMVFRMDGRETVVTAQDFLNIKAKFKKISSSSKFEDSIDFSFLWELDSGIIPLETKRHDKYRTVPALGFIAHIDTILLEEHNRWLKNEI